MDGSSDDDNVNHTDDKPSHTNTRTKKKTAPIVVAGAELSTLQEMLLKTVADKKFAIRITRIGHRIDLIGGEDYKKVKTTALDDMVKADKVIGYYSYHTPDTRPHKIMLFGLYKMEKMS